VPKNGREGNDSGHEGNELLADGIRNAKLGKRLFSRQLIFPC